MIKRLVFLLLALFFVLSQILFSKASADHTFRGRLMKDTITIRLLGQAVNLGPALNVTLSFGDPEVARLDSSNPAFEGLGVNALLTQSYPESNMVSVVWDDYIVNNEVRIITKLVPLTKAGRTGIKVKKVETVGGRDITDSIVALVEPQEVVAIGIKDSNFLGNIDLIEQGELTAPGKAAVAFEVERIPQANVLTRLNGSQVDFIDDNTGVAIVDLPEDGGKLDLELEVSSSVTKEKVNIGTIDVLPSTGPGRRPHVRRAFADNNGTRKLRIEGRRFGVLRFGRDDTKIEVVPANQDRERINLWKRQARFRLSESECVQEGSYVNVSHPAGTDAKKIIVVGECN